jgi:hypothetical protein
LVVVAVALLAGVVCLGINSKDHRELIVWFGIASAIVAPTGFSLLRYAFGPPMSKTIQELGKVPEIRELVEKAKTQEEKVKLLEGELSRLDEIVKLESRRQTARDRVESLERDGVRIVRELDALDRELQLFDEQIGQSAVSQEIQSLRERLRAREKGDIFLTFGKRVYHLDRSVFTSMPLGIGYLYLVYFELLKLLSRGSAKRPAK